MKDNVIHLHRDGITTPHPTPPTHPPKKEERNDDSCVDPSSESDEIVARPALFPPAPDSLTDRRYLVRACWLIGRQAVTTKLCRRRARLCRVWGFCSVSLSPAISPRNVRECCALPRLVFHPCAGAPDIKQQRENKLQRLSSSGLAVVLPSKRVCFFFFAHFAAIKQQRKVKLQHCPLQGL